MVGLRWPVLFLIGLACIAVQTFAWFGIHLPQGTEATATIARTREIYGNQGFLAILQFRWEETWSFILPILRSVLPRTVGLMFWGAAAWRSGILASPERYRGRLIVALVVSGAAGAMLTANDVWAQVAGHAPWPALKNTQLDATILLALAYVAGLLLWLTPERAERWSGLAALGRMALTNYLMQSILLGVIFYGYGFGLFGRIGPAGAAGIGVAIYIAQIYLSRFWLARFRFGPFEWLWRSLTYGRKQPI